MKKTLLEVYALAVCFFVVACFVVALGVALYDLVQIGDPDFTLGRYRYDLLQTNEAFREAPGEIPGKNEADRKAMPDDQVTRRREAAYALALGSERREGEQSLLRVIIVMLIDAVAFLIHWRIAKRARLSGA